jgi:hypothetical protein
MLAVVLGILTLGGSMAMTPKEQKLSFSGPFRDGSVEGCGIPTRLTSWHCSRWLHAGTDGSVMNADLSIVQVELHGQRGGD